MIADTVIGMFAWVVAHCLNLLPDWTLPGFVVALPDGAATLGGYVGSFSAWLPVDVLLAVFVFVPAAFVVAVSVRIVRMIISLLSGGGGSVS